jgi:hypothetical protein
MKRVLVTSLVVLAATSTYGLKASAQEVGQPGYFERRMAAPVSAFEIGVSPLYNQGWGNLTDVESSAAAAGRKLQDTAHAGAGIELDLGYRVMPMFTVGAFGTITEFNRDDRLATDTNVRSVTAGVQGQWFARPYHVINPWVGLGSAYRGFWTVPEVGGITQRHGWQIARLEIGVDLRASREISIGPYVGGSVDVFFKEKIPGQDSRNLNGPPVSGFFMAGVNGRFDIGGQYVNSATGIARR